jgi:hypothetical protein
MGSCQHEPGSPIFNDKVVTLAWLWSLMMAPHSLALHGNLAGQWGRWLPLGLMAAAGVYLVFVHAPWQPPEFATPAVPEIGSPRSWMGGGISILALGAQLLTALAGGTGLLVTAGFSFNETFLYWFPNFAFAFLLLGAIVLLHVVGQRWVQRLQVLFMAVALGGLLLLSLVALAPSAGGPAPSAGMPPLPSPFKWAPVLLLFVGLDLARLTPLADGAQTRRLMDIGVLGAALIFSLWGWAAVRQVPLERLADTTIAQVLVAKGAWGQWGRYTMGMVTLAGALAAVNALFSIVAATAQGIGREIGGSGPRLPPAAVAVFLGIATAMAMATGLAGTERIDVALRAGLVLWLLYYALCLPAGQVDLLVRRPLLLMAGGLLLAGAGVLVLTHPDRNFMLTAMLTTLSAAALVGGGLWGWARIIGERSRK